MSDAAAPPCMGTTQRGQQCALEGIERVSGWVGCGHHQARPEPATLTLGEHDARLVRHLVWWLVHEGLAGEPTRELLAEIDRRLEPAVATR